MSVNEHMSISESSISLEDELESLSSKFELESAEAVLSWALRTFGSDG